MKNITQFLITAGVGAVAGNKIARYRNANRPFRFKHDAMPISVGISISSGIGMVTRSDPTAVILGTILVSAGGIAYFLTPNHLVTEDKKADASKPVPTASNNTPQTIPTTSPNPPQATPTTADKPQKKNSSSRTISAILRIAKPFVFSEFTKSSLKEKNISEHLTNILMFAVFNTCLNFFENEENKDKKTDKPLVPVPKPTAISQLSEDDKEFLKDLMMPNSDDLEDFEKIQYNYWKNIHDTTTDKRELFQIKFELDDLYRNHYKRELDFYKRASLAQINNLFQSNTLKNTYYEQKVNTLFYNHSISSSNNIKEATRIGQKQASMLSDMCKKMSHLKSSMKSYETAFTHKNIEVLLEKNNECKKIIKEIYDTESKNQTDKDFGDTANNIIAEIHNDIIPEYVQRLKRDREYRAWARSERRRKQQQNTGNTSQQQQQSNPNRNIPEATKEDMFIDSLEHKALDKVNKYLGDKAQTIEKIMQAMLPHDTSNDAAEYDQKQSKNFRKLQNLYHPNKAIQETFSQADKQDITKALTIISSMLTRLNNIDYYFNLRDAHVGHDETWKKDG
jgi:hypothetical protein